MEESAAMIPSLLVAAGLGLLAGAQHALGGPDHFAGVAPFAAREGRSAWRVGMGWGLGHATGAAAAAAIALALRAAIPGIEEHLSGFSDRVVGILMCVVGAIGLRSALRARRPTDRSKHALVDPGAPNRHDDDHGHASTAFGLGLFHGAGGLAHLFAVVPALGFPGVAQPALYLTGYALGSLALITAFATVVGRVARDDRPRARRGVLAAASVASLAIGLVWALSPT